MIQGKSRGDKLFDTINHAALLLIALVMLFPFVYVVLGSFTSFEDFARGGVIIIPEKPSLEAYRFVLSSPTLMRAIVI